MEGFKDIFHHKIVFLTTYLKFFGHDQIPLSRFFVILKWILISEAFKVVKTIWNKPLEGLKMKKVFEQNVSLHEAFLESVPTALITQALLVYRGKSFY